MTTIRVLWCNFKDEKKDISLPQSKNLQITVNSEKYKLKILECFSLKDYFYESLKLKQKSPKLIIAGFSVVFPRSYKAVFKEMVLHLADNISSIPVILIGYHTKCRKGTEELKDEISTKMGEELARRINAVKYLECPDSIFNETEMEGKTENSILTEIDWASLQLHKTKVSRAPRKTSPFSMNVVGLEESGKAEMIRRFVFNERLNVVGNCLNEQPYFYEEKDDCFHTCIELDGEVHSLVVKDWTLSDDVRYLSFLLRIPNLTLFIFSVVQPLNFKIIKEKIKLMNLSSIIIVGYQTDLRNHSKTLRKLSKRKEQPITFEMGAQLARDLDAVKYLECSSSDDTEIQKVFEEAVWTLLRHKEQVQNEKQKRNQKDL